MSEREGETERGERGGETEGGKREGETETGEERGERKREREREYICIYVCGQLAKAESLKHGHGRMTIHQ